MAITALPPDTDADIARVSEALAMITPRWNVRILLALSGPPLRYSELAAKVSWLQNGQLHPKLKALCDAGLVERTEHTARHVTYGHTERGVALLPVLPMIVTWAEEHLETADRPLPAIEQIEDSLTLLTRRHAAAILWVLKSRGEVSGRALARIVMPSSDWTNVYPPLRQLVADGLVDTEGIGQALPALRGGRRPEPRSRRSVRVVRRAAPQPGGPTPSLGAPAGEGRAAAVGQQPVPAGPRSPPAGPDG